MARPLKIFMRGKNVAALQELLRRMGYNIDDQARQFGASTRDAVKSYQRQQGLSPTGHVDEVLLNMMQQGQTNSPTTHNTNNDNLPPSSPVNQQQLDAVIRLLIQKDIITDAELQQEIARPQPLRVSQKPLI